MSSIDGWGKDQWGLESWGSAASLDPLAIESAVAINTKTVQVTLNREAQVIASTVAGDALNPATWVIQRLDTGFFFSVLSIVQISPLVFNVSVLQDFGPSSVTHRILSTTLLASEGSPIAGPPLNQADFAGLLSVAAKDERARANQRINAVQDVANPPFPTVGDNTTIGGTLQIDSSGDYRLESGAPLLRKLIIRRLTTPVGGFYHLPDYGVDLGVKKLLPAANLIKLRADINRQVQREPEVETSDVQLELGSDNDLTVRVKALLSFGEPLDFSFTATSEGVVLL